MFKFIKNQSGLGIVETLMGGAIVSLAALGLGMSINSMAKSTAKTKAVADAVSLESLMVGALQDPSTYAPYREMLKNGQLSLFQSSFQMTLPGYAPITARTNQPNHFTSSGQACNDYASNKDCLLRVSLQVRQLSATPPSYGFAYRIETNPLSVNMVALGVPGQFDNDDYRLLVPSSIYRDDVGCEQGAGSSDIPFAARGFNFDRGQLTCWKGPTAADQCAAGSFPVGLQIVGDRITFRCQALTQVSCNNGPSGSLYALSNFRPAELSKANTGVAANARCSFVAQAETDALTGTQGQQLGAQLPLTGNAGKGADGQWRYGVQGPNGSQWATFCPAGYDAEITCEAVVANTWNPQPPRCPSGYPGDCAAATTGYPAAGVWFGAAATYGGTPVPPERVGEVISQTNGNQARCVLNNGSQPAGAGWSGYVNMSVRCVVNRDVYPETVAPVVASNPGGGGT